MDLPHSDDLKQFSNYAVSFRINRLPVPICRTVHIYFDTQPPESEVIDALILQDPTLEPQREMLEIVGCIPYKNPKSY